MREIVEKEPRENGYLDITAMVRSLQRTEGYADCFRTGVIDCDQTTCAWREYCFQKQDGGSTDNGV